MSDLQDLQAMDFGSLKPTLEAMLLVASEPVSAVSLSKILGTTPGEVAAALAELSAEYSDANRGF